MKTKANPKQKASQKTEGKINSGALCKPSWAGKRQRTSHRLFHPAGNGMFNKCQGGHFYFRRPDWLNAAI